MSQSLTIHRRICFHRAGQRKVLCRESEQINASSPKGRIPRAARLMALAIRLEDLLRSGQPVNYAEVARLGYVSRARVTQITNLTLLAADIQEAILFLPAVQQGPDPVTDRDLRPLVAEPDWQKQRQMWARLNRKLARITA